MGQVIAYPLSRRVGFVSRQARTMASMSSDAAERYLASQLRQQRQTLERKSVERQSIDQELQNVERAIRARLWHEVFFRPGGAV